MPGSWEVEADTHRVHQTDLHIMQLGHQTTGYISEEGNGI